MEVVKPSEGSDSIETILNPSNKLKRNNQLAPIKEEEVK
jgi:hypothetical protein